MFYAAGNFWKKKKKRILIIKKRNTVGGNGTSVFVFLVNGTAVYICDHQIHFPN